MKAVVIAIDGPSGSGKSSTARGVAQRLGYSYLDTGSIYRALTYYCLNHGIAPDDSDEVVKAAHRMHVDVNPVWNDFSISVDGVDISRYLHEPRISAVVAHYAGIAQVRLVMIDLMRSVIDRYSPIVVEGRDITTVVAPHADVRILLQASDEARMARRSKQLDGALNRDDLRDQVVGRDALDSQVSNFLTPADDGVYVIDSTSMSLNQVIEMVIDLCHRAKIG